MPVPLRNTANRYGAIAQALHWAVAAGIALQFVWAWRIQETDSVRERFHLVNQHKSIGVTVLALVLLRIAWRSFNRPPPLPASMARWERRAAGISHGLLYALVLAMPVSGWIYTSAAGFGPEFFGLVDLPALVPVNETLEELAGVAHRIMAWAVAVAVTVHAAAALRHRFWLRDEVLKRMLPGWK